MLRASVSRLACKATNGGITALVPFYVGSIVKSVSGTIPKSDLLALTEKGSPSLTLVEVVATGAGAPGLGTSLVTASIGGRPGLVDRKTVAYNDLPDSIAFIVGAGIGDSAGVSSADKNGGFSEVAGIVHAAGGRQVWAPLDPKDRPTGPGQGSYQRPDDSTLRRGGHSNDSIPEIRLTGTTGNGRNATTPFQHGTGGASNSQHGYVGGWPGGGGGKGGGSGYRGGASGGGSVVYHVYELRRP